MGTRGPKPGWKNDKRAVAQAARNTARREERRARREAEAAAAAAAQPAIELKPTALSQLSEAQRNNPRYLSGALLREFANRQGMSRSELADMGDEKVREQLRYITSRRYESVDATAGA